MRSVSGQRSVNFLIVVVDLYVLMHGFSPSVWRELRRFKALVRRDHGEFSKEALVFHGTDSRALPGIVKAGGVVPHNVLEVRRILPVTGELYFSKEPGAVGRSAVSVSRGRDVDLALHYALQSVKTWRRIHEYIEDELEYLRSFRLRGKSSLQPLDAEDFHYGLRLLAGRVRSFFSKAFRSAGEDRVYPVVVATLSRVRNPAEMYDVTGNVEIGEEYLVQIPVHLSYFFVPDEHVRHARSILSKRGRRYAARVFPFSVLEALYGVNTRKKDGSSVNLGAP